jgi:dolichol-phosphate mannosyltransferase
MNVVLVIPAYSQTDNIGNLVATLEETVFPLVHNHELSILIAGEDSSDGTAEVGTALIVKYPKLRISRGEEGGPGSALLQGMGYAVREMGAQVIVEMDADLQHDPAQIPDLLRKIDEGYDMVVGTRFSDGGSTPSSWPFRRKLVASVGNLLARGILLKFSLHDWTGGYRALRGEVFQREHLELASFDGATYRIAFLNKAVRDGFRVAELPVKSSAPHSDASKMPSLRSMARALRYVVSATMQEKLGGSFGKFLVVGGIGFVIQAVILRLLVGVVGTDPTIANLSGAAVSIFSNFNLNNMWTFGSRKIEGLAPYLRKMASFYATSAIGVVAIQTGVILAGDTIFGRGLYFAYFMLGTALLLIYNFSVYRLIIWRREPQTPQ